jgi:hypothetical protein
MHGSLDFVPNEEAPILAKGAKLQPAGAAEKGRARKTDNRQAQQGVSVAELAAREG